MDEAIPRTEKDGTEMQASGEINRATVVPHKRPVPAGESQEDLQPRQSIFKRWTSGRVVLMTGKSSTDKGVSIPYPILTGIVTVVIWLAGLTGMLIYNLATMNANFANLNSNLINRDAAQAREIQSLREENAQKLNAMKSEYDMLNTWIQTARERIIKLEAQRGIPPQ